MGQTIFYVLYVFIHNIPQGRYNYIIPILQIMKLRKVTKLVSGRLRASTKKKSGFKFYNLIIMLYSSLPFISEIVIFNKNIWENVYSQGQVEEYINNQGFKLYSMPQTSVNMYLLKMGKRA